MKKYIGGQMVEFEPFPCPECGATIDSIDAYRDEFRSAAVVVGMCPNGCRPESRLSDLDLVSMTKGSIKIGVASDALAKRKPKREEKDPEIATGAAMDAIGETYCVTRRRGETDADFRSRILHAMAVTSDSYVPKGGRWLVD